MTTYEEAPERFEKTDNHSLAYQYADGRKVYNYYSREGELLAEVTVKNGRVIDYDSDVG